MKSRLYRWWDREGSAYTTIFWWAVFIALAAYVGLKPDDPTLEQLIYGY